MISTAHQPLFSSGDANAKMSQFSVKCVIKDIWTCFREASGGRLFNQMDAFESRCKEYLTKQSVILLIGPADISMFAHMDAIYAKRFPACEITCSLHDCGGSLLLLQRFLLIVVPGMECVRCIAGGFSMSVNAFCLFLSFWSDLLSLSAQTTKSSRKSKPELSKQTISIIKGAIHKILKVVPGKVYCSAFVVLSHTENLTHHLALIGTNRLVWNKGIVADLYHMINNNNWHFFN